jgi:hypothetical protein
MSFYGEPVLTLLKIKVMLQAVTTRWGAPVRPAGDGQIWLPIQKSLRRGMQ